MDVVHEILFKTYLQYKNNVQLIYNAKMTYKHFKNMYTTWPSAGSPAFKGLESLVLRCGIFLTLITLFVAIMSP